MDVKKIQDAIAWMKQGGLRILSSSTCVGLRYGYNMNNSGFSWHMAHMLPYSCSVHVTSSD